MPAVHAPLPHEPMYASVGTDMPVGSGWTFEPKYDGMRVLAEASTDGVRLVTRNGKNKAPQFPEIVASLTRLVRRKRKPVVLDGEIVALDAKGNAAPFQRLQGRFHLGERAAIASLSIDAPAALVAFDLLAVGTRSLTSAPWTTRREELEALVGAGDRSLRVSESSADGERMLRTAQRSGWEGVIAKRVDAAYAAGARSRDWLKLKLQHRAEFVVGGFTEPRRTRPYLGAILLGYFDDDGVLRYVGHTGGGFDHEGLREMRERLDRLERKTSPFATVPHANDVVHWVRPEVMVEVKFAEWTADGRLRQPIYLGVRDDKSAREVKRERESVQRWGHADADRVTAPRRAAAARERPQRTRTRTTKRAARGTTTRTTTSAAERAINGGKRVSKAVVAPGRHAGEARKAVAQIEEIMRSPGDGTLELGGGKRLHVSSLDKPYFPASGITKGELMRYYAQVAPVLLPLIAGRPLVLKRYPDGLGGGSFFQQSAGATTPDEVRMAELDTADGERTRRIIAGDLFTLLYTVQIGTIAVHPWESRLTTIDQADYSTIDLDPGDGVEFSAVVALARLVKAELDTLGLTAALKTSGSRGLHIAVPLPRRTSYDDAARLAERVATRVADAHPELATVERRLDKRPRGTIYVDAQQNARGKSMVSAYSARAREPGAVSAPLRWTELRSTLRLEAFTIRTMPARLARVGDLWGEALARRNPARAMARAIAR